jgi:SAM-dependent methyltransferase
MTNDTPARYVYSDQTSGGNHHADLVNHLAAILDPFSKHRIEPYLFPSARCLEVAAGAGTIAQWLADQLGPDGTVVATDTDPSHIPHHRRLTARQHDIVTDPLEGTFDIIHARLVLAHLPQRRQVLAKLVRALNPGGVIVVDEFASGGWERCVLDTPDGVAVEAAQRLFNAYYSALVTVMERDGTTDTGWGRGVHRAMREAGLTDVDTELWARSYRGGEPGCLLPHTAAAQLRPRLLAAGMPAGDIDAFRKLLRDPGLVIHAGVAISTVGRSSNQ